MLYSSSLSGGQTTLKTALSPFPNLSHIQASWIGKIFGHLGGNLRLNVILVRLDHCGKPITLTSRQEEAKEGLDYLFIALTNFHHLFIFYFIFLSLILYFDYLSITLKNFHHHHPTIIIRYILYSAMKYDLMVNSVQLINGSMKGNPFELKEY